MFLYELITLRQPFEGHETVKESILEGSRPVFTMREVMFPSYCLDLMVLCWDQQPNVSNRVRNKCRKLPNSSNNRFLILATSQNRPSASQIVSIACAPEFTHLIDVVLLPHSDNALAMLTQSQRKSKRDASFKLWLSVDRSLEILTGLEYGWLSYQRCQPYQMLLARSEPSVRMTAMCCVTLNTIWFGDSRGSIHSFK